MGRKIFISYKYGDMSVQHLKRNAPWEVTRVRDYVDELQEKLDDEDHINKGEKDGEDLSNFKDSTIESKLRDKIYDSSITIVLISPCMRDVAVPESDQWIPWEIAYSLREPTRKGKTSHCNGVLAVVLPDRIGSYNYMLETKNCCSSGCIVWHTEKLFKILQLNMFNQKVKSPMDCIKGDDVYRGLVSYIHMVRWDEFIGNINGNVFVAEMLANKKNEYEIRVNV